MATIYKIELVSHWVNYSPKELEELLKKALLDDDFRNEVKVEAERK